MKLTENTANSCLGMFAKYWEPGKVKTRLAARVGDRAASGIYLAFLTTLLRSLGDCADRQVIAFDPPNQIEEFERIAGANWELTPQIPKPCADDSNGVPRKNPDLGQRMSNFFQAQLSLSNRVILIGSDTPTISAGEIRSAFEELATHDVVLGPAIDGGYWLIGMNRFVPQLFEHIKWSTDSVFAQTIEVLQRDSVSWSKLDVRNDIDDWTDLRQLNDELRESASVDSQLQNVVAQVVNQAAQEHS